MCRYGAARSPRQEIGLPALVLTAVRYPALVPVTLTAKVVPASAALVSQLALASPAEMGTGVAAGAYGMGLAADVLVAVW